MLFSHICQTNYIFPEIRDGSNRLLYDNSSFAMPITSNYVSLSGQTFLNNSSSPLLPSGLYSRAKLNGTVYFNTNESSMCCGMLLCGVLDLNGNALSAIPAYVNETNKLPGCGRAWPAGRGTAAVAYSRFSYICRGGNGGASSNCVWEYYQGGLSGAKGGGGAGGSAYYAWNNEMVSAIGGGGGGMMIIIADKVIGSGTFSANAIGGNAHGGGGGGGSINIFCREWAVTSVSISVAPSYPSGVCGGQHGVDATDGIPGNAALWHYDLYGNLTLMAATTTNTYGGTDWPIAPINGSNFQKNFY